MSRDKRRIFAELVDEVRRSQNATDRFDQAVADALGVNRTDMRCMDVLEREGPVTAGRLAEASGLTSGAITSVLDRLERAGYARRVPDPSDRRRVLVEITPHARELADGFFSAHMALSEQLYRRYTLAQLELLLGYVSTARRFNEQQAALLEQRNRASGEGERGA
ncbi:MAG TPA: MarR family transcriptional regulator [Solirubrobacteraceae bacterium]|nr:MarR family transcriptional regulator [Solirubrobacteraceae bacterium]